MKVQLIRSLISVRKAHRIVVKNLGLRKLWSSSEVPSSDYIFGALEKVRYLVRILRP